MWARRVYSVCTLALCFSSSAAFTPKPLLAQQLDAVATMANEVDLPQPLSTSTKTPLTALPAETQGDLLMARGQYAAALDAYQRESADSAARENKIGVAYHHLLAPEEAKKHYEMAIRLNPHYAEALNNLAAVYHGEHNYKQAAKLYKQSLKIAPNAAITWKNLGTAYVSDGKYKQGTEAYRKALALNPSAFQNHTVAPIEDTGSHAQRRDIDYYLAKTFAVSGDSRQALLCLRRAVAAGFSDRHRLSSDKDFAQLHGMPEFEQLMASISTSGSAHHARS